MSNDYECVIGQLFGRFDKLPKSYGDCVEMGFAAPDGLSLAELGAYYIALDEAWKEEIAKRLLPS